MPRAAIRPECGLFPPAACPIFPHQAAVGRFSAALGRDGARRRRRRCAM